jgi:membrane-associated phospholipid phosphatase
MSRLFRNTSFFICYLIFLLIGGVVLFLYSKTDIFLFINQNNHFSTDYFFKYYTNVGDGIFYAVVVIGLLFYKFRYAIISAAAFLISALSAQLLKRLVFTGEYRPSRFLKEAGIEFHVIEGVKLHSNNSFPSGHATTAFSIFCLLSILWIDKRYGVLFFILALLASYSRVYIGQHFFADIYAGSIIGIVTTLLTFYLLDNYFNKLNKLWPERNLLNRKLTKA